MSHDILIVDDETDIRLLMSGILKDEGYDTREAGDSDSALAAVRTRKPSLVLLDIWLKNSKLDGMQILSVLRREHPDLPVVMISGHGNVQTAVAAIKEGAYDYLEKPFKADRLLVVVARAVEAAQLKRENQELKLRVGADADLIGQSGVMRQLDAAVERVAPTNSRVLIAGPPGAGKEVIARLIHRRSARSAGPFIAANCAIMDPDRFEAELFGIEASPAGDGRSRTGLLEAAHGGTLFLDEVADMPLATQGKIVRILQEQVFERVGGGTKVQVDVRVVAATNRDLKAEIAADRFREDLFYRLNVIEVAVPPLRERPEEIVPLAAHFIGLYSRQRPRFSASVAAALGRHRWPGNVRELRNAMERAALLSRGEVVLPEHLPARIMESPPPAAAEPVDGQRLAEIEREAILRALRKNGFNRTETARELAISRRALTYKLQRLRADGVPVDG